MTTREVTLIDYGVGNLLSVTRGLEHWGANVTISAEPDAIRRAPRVILPGVGAFRDGAMELERRGLDEAVRDVARSGTPLLGICLGMQLLLDESEEFGITPGLGLIPGRAVMIPRTTVEGDPHKVPHIGWSPIAPTRDDAWKGTILDASAPGEAFYFVHSFMAEPNDARHRIADAHYGGRPIAAVIARDNVSGCQFHTEKSGEAGLRVLREFLSR